MAASTWIVRGEDTLLAASKARDLLRAKREWRVTYAYEDLGAAAGVCELCGHPAIRYQYEIENRTTGRHLWVGSECIKKFIPVYLKGREVVDEREKGRVVERIAGTLRTAARERRAFALLVELARHDDRFRDEKWRSGWRLGFSVKQLQLIAVVAKEASLPFRSADFRINTRRGRVREQLFDLAAWQYRQLRGALTDARRREADARFSLVVEPQRRRA